MYHNDISKKGATMISSNISSINAHQNWLNNSAHNTANVNTEDFTPNNTTINGASENSVVANSSPASQTQTDIANELTNQINIERATEANAVSIRAEDQMMGSLLDIRA